MINMIKADFYRIIRSKALYIAVFLLVLMLGISIYMVEPGMLGNAPVSSNQITEEITFNGVDSEEYDDMSMSDFRKAIVHADGYELDREIVAQNMNLYYIFIFIVAIVISADFSSKGVKNTLSSTISRKKYFLSKILFVNLLCLVLFFLNTYLAHFGNIIFNSKEISASLGTITKTTLLQLPPMLASVSILTGFAFILRKNSLFNTVTIPLILVFQIILSTSVMLLKIPEKFLNYELQSMFMSLAHNPSNKYISNSCLVCAIVVISFNVIGYMCFKKSEIK
ncbi:MAG: ABC transporter permease [Ruminococcus sp.]|nr:ABC transporter permease [Ruminococcus sp.]